MADESKPLSAAEIEAKDLAFWRQRSMDQKFAATMQLALSAWHLQGNSGPALKIDLSVHGVRELVD